MDHQTNGPCNGTTFATQTKFNNNGKRTQAISQVFHDIYGTARECDLCVVIAQQTVFLQSAEWALENKTNTDCVLENYTVNANGDQLIDMLAGTHYIRPSDRWPGQSFYNDVLDEINSNFQNPFAPDVQQLIADATDDWLQNTVKPSATANAALAAEYNMCYGTYEGDTHLDFNKPVSAMTNDELFVWEAYWFFLQNNQWTAILLDGLNFHNSLPNGYRLNSFASIGVCTGPTQGLPQDGRPWDLWDGYDGSSPNVVGSVNAHNQYNLVSQTKK